MTKAAKVQTARVPIELIAPQPEHCQYLYELYAKPVVMRAHGLKLPPPAVNWRRIIQGVWDGWKSVWIIRQGHLLVGHVALQDHSDPDRRAEVVITVDPSRQGRGIGKEALGTVLARCDGELGIEVLVARVKEGNDRALGLFTARGFSEAGRIPRYYREPDGLPAQIILSRCVAVEPAPSKKTRLK